MALSFASGAANTVRPTLCGDSVDAGLFIAEVLNGLLEGCGSSVHAVFPCVLAWEGPQSMWFLTGTFPVIVLAPFGLQPVRDRVGRFSYVVAAA